MNLNSELLAEYRRVIRRAKGDALDELMHEKAAYETACELSRGSDPDRCEHWERQAVEAEKRLAGLVARHAKERA